MRLVGAVRRLLVSAWCGAALLVGLCGPAGAQTTATTLATNPNVPTGSVDFTGDAGQAVLLMCGLISFVVGLKIAHELTGRG